jgi:hypothetical protein
MQINTQAHHAAWPTVGGSWFVSCCWGRGREYSPAEVVEILAALERDNPPGDCCSDLWRRIAAEVKNTPAA